MASRIAASAPRSAAVTGSKAPAGPFARPHEDVGRLGRQPAQVDRTELWTDVKPGSLYNALKRMTDEGLVRVARTEREGNPPERTVFEITEAGRAELVRQRDTAMAEVRLLPDPVDLALQFTPDLTPEELIAAFTKRRQAVAERLAQFEREQETAAPDLVGLEPLIFVNAPPARMMPRVYCSVSTAPFAV